MVNGKCVDVYNVYIGHCTKRCSVFGVLSHILLEKPRIIQKKRREWKDRNRERKNKKQITNQQKLIDCCNRPFAANVNGVFLYSFYFCWFCCCFSWSSVTMVYVYTMIIIIIICIQDKKWWIIILWLTPQCTENSQRAQWTATREDTMTAKNNNDTNNIATRIKEARKKDDVIAVNKH